MASFFDSLGDKLNVMGKGIADKAKEVSDLSKLNTQIREEERKVQSAYQEMGEQYYKLHKEDPTPEFSENILAVDASLARIAQLKAEIQKLKGVCTCANCGAEVPVTAQFCSSCGAKIEHPVVEETPAAEAHTCPNCGAAVEADAVFCPECGGKISSEDSEEPTEDSTEE